MLSKDRDPRGDQIVSFLKRGSLRRGIFFTGKHNLIAFGQLLLILFSCKVVIRKFELIYLSWFNSLFLVL